MRFLRDILRDDESQSASIHLQLDFDASSAASPDVPENLNRIDGLKIDQHIRLILFLSQPMIQLFEWGCRANRKTGAIVNYLRTQINKLREQDEELCTKSKAMEDQILALQQHLDSLPLDQVAQEDHNRLDHLTRTHDHLEEQRARWEELKDEMIDTQLTEIAIQGQRLMQALKPLEACLKHSGMLNSIRTHISKNSTAPQSYFGTTTDHCGKSSRNTGTAIIWRPCAS